MNRAIIIVMMDFLISSFLLFMDFGSENNSGNYKINNSRNVNFVEELDTDNPILITDSDVEGHYETLFIDDYYNNLQTYVDTLNNNLVAINDKINESQRDLAKKISENKQLDVRLKEVSVENQSLYEKNLDLKNKSDKMRDDLSHATNQVEDYKRELKSIKLNNSLLKQENAEKDNIIREKEGILDEKDKLIAEKDLRIMEKDNLINEQKGENEYLIAQNNSYLSQINKSQQNMQKNIETLKETYERESQQQKALLLTLVNTSNNIRDEIQAAKTYNAQLSENLEMNLIEELQKINKSLEEKEKNLRNAQDEFKDAVLSNNRELIETMKLKIDTAKSELDKVRQASGDLDMKNAVTSPAAEMRTVGESRIQFALDVTDNDLFSKDSKHFETFGVIVNLSNGNSAALAHAEPFGLFWNQYSDGLSKANLTGRKWESGSPKSQSYSTFSALSSNPVIIIPQPHGVRGLKLHKAADFHPYNLEQSNLKYYSQKSPSLHENMDTWKIEPTHKSLKLPENIILKVLNDRKPSPGDFIVDSNGYLICMMISVKECSYIFEDDINIDTSEYKFDIDNLKQFSEKAAAYNKEMK